MKPGIYIIDHELVSPIATGKEEIHKALESNFTADDFLPDDMVGGIPFKKGALIRDRLDHLIRREKDPIQEVSSIDRKLELIVAAYQLGLPRMEKLISMFDPLKTGVIMGVGADVAPYRRYEDELVDFLSQQLNPIYELMVRYNRSGFGINRMNNPYDLYSLYLASKFNAKAFQRSILTACVSSTQAIAFGMESIKRGETEVVIAGGTDSIINFLALISFGKLGVIVETEEKISCKPFDLNRFGTLAGEAAGFTILASEDFVERNGLEPLAELTGYGNTLDAYKITAPDPSGEQMTRAIKNCVSMAGLKTSEIDYINAHGTGTRQNDATELNAIKTALGSGVETIPISSTKDRHGHAIAAAGNQEISILLEIMKHGLIPANLHMNLPVDDAMNLVRKNGTGKIRNAISNNFAFGGINTVLSLKNML